MARDYYDILGVNKSASADEIKKAYRKKAHELHPDKKTGDAEAFKQVNEAYQVLGDAQKRSTYDQFGHAAFQGGGMPGAGGFGGFNGFGGQQVNINMDDLGDLGDVLGDMFGFGGGHRTSRRNRGRDLEATVDISFMDAVTGTVKPLEIRALATCQTCNGRGGEGSKQCADCNGQGRVARQQRTPLGVIQTAVTCHTCHGRGTVPEKKCHTCDGTGVHAQNKTLNIQIPAGIATGETIRLTGQGEAAPHGGSTGDLYVHVRVAAHPHLRRNGSDIVSEEQVPISTLLLGGTVAIETVQGQGDLKIPAGTSAGTTFRLRNHGMPSLHNRSKGDHLVTVMPAIPTKLSRDQKKAAERLKEEGM